jgi:two-component system sensor histidine kinase BaeS
MLLAARSETIENAWMSALPGVGIAAGIATPFAVIVAVFLARQIARPVHQLTLASEAMARGDFDQRVEVEREDEVGRLAKAFSVMAQRVGERDAQMRSLIANVSHDLKTPMSSILGYSQALRDGVTDDHTRVADVINAQAQHAARLLEDLLFLSEVDAGQVLGQLEDVQAADVITPAVSLLEHRAEEQGVTIDVKVAGGLVLRGVDSDRVVRALANVLDNGIRFATPASSVTVRAFADGEASVIAVANDGPHIPDDELPHIFERFFRGGADASGHGLGLAIAKEAVVISNGAVEAANTPTGVEVRLRFPA